MAYNSNKYGYPKDTNKNYKVYRVGKLKSSYSITENSSGVTINEKSTPEQLNAEKLSKFKAVYTSISFALELVMVLLMLVSLLRILNGTPYIPKFQELLQTLSNTPDIGAGINKALSILKIGGDWGILDPIRSFFNTLTGLVSVTGWLVGGILQVVTFLFHFITWIFPVV